MLANILTMFSAAPEALALDQGGFGIGLPLAKQPAELHGLDGHEAWWRTKRRRRSSWLGGSLPTPPFSTSGLPGFIGLEVARRLQGKRST